jgi:DNA-binding transcriptional LysR family regulator
MIVCASPAYLATRGVPQAPGDLAHHDCLVFSDAPGSAEWRFADGSKAGRKIRISGRLWMNSLDALATAAKEGAGIVRVPSWQAEADLAAGHLVRLLADYEPAPAPLHLMFQPSRLASRRSGPSSIISLSGGAEPILSRADLRRTTVRFNIQFFGRARWPWYTKPLNQSHFVAP